jgi:polyisoprenoid-binding protein YceI
LAVLGGGLGLTAIALAAALFALVAPGGGAPAAQAPSTFEVTEAATTETIAPAIATPAAEGPAPVWTVDPRASSIVFAYTVDDGSGANAFEGRFTRWRADIRFDPNDLANSAVAVTIDTASAETSVAAHANTLREAGWFNPARYPTATFRAREFRQRDGGYEARGELTIRDRGRNIDLPFTLTIDGATAQMGGALTLDREDFGIGEGSEANRMISREIGLTLRVRANRAP